MPKVDEEILKEEVLRQCNDYIEGFSNEKLTASLERLSKSFPICGTIGFN
jgi:hypothetical protein